MSNSADTESPLPGSILDEFEMAWQECPGPDVRSFLSNRGHSVELATKSVDPAAAAQTSMLVEILLIDVERRLRSGIFFDETPLTNSYQRLFPSLTPYELLTIAVDEYTLGSRLRSQRYEPTVFLSALVCIHQPERQSLEQQIQNLSPGANASRGSINATPEWGSLVGRYRIVRRIGAGGMGIVYEAEQESDVRRKVALKIIQMELLSTEGLRRFHAERQALAMMNHEHIARVLDAGISNNGHPYFAMELVEGWSLTEFCDHHRSSVNERLALFIQTCDAIHHAHQKGIVHRDIKPSNILAAVRENEPSVKVIDFGVAKLLQTDAQQAAETNPTRSGDVVGTLLYMSPEQAASSSDIDVRSDVYSLGVLLYELLTGTTPVSREEFGRMAVLEVHAAIQNREPPRPSTRLESLTGNNSLISSLRKADARRLRLELQGDLDWIVMKALEKDPNRRYDGASQFAEDIKRYLDGHPVIARPPSTTYRVRKFVQRNKGLVTALSGVFGILLVSSVISTKLMLLARTATQSAEGELILRKQAEQAILKEKQVAVDERKSAENYARMTLNTLINVIREQQSVLRNVEGAGEIRRRLLLTALSDIQQISRNHLDAQAADHTTMQGFLELGDVVMEVGLENRELPTESLNGSVLHTNGSALPTSDSALQTAEHLFRRAQTIARELDSTNSTPVSKRDLAVSIFKTARVCRMQGQAQESEVLYRNALEIANNLRSSRISAASLRSLFFNCHQTLGDLAMERGDLSLAMAEYDQMTSATTGSEKDDKVSDLRSYSIGLERIGTLALERREFEVARHSFESCVQVRRELLMRQENGVQEQRDLAIVLAKLSEVLTLLDLPNDSIQPVVESLRIRQELRQDNPGMEAISDLANAYIFHANSLRTCGLFRESLESAAEAESHYKVLLETERTNLKYAIALGVSIRLQSLAEQFSGDITAAIATIKRCQNWRKECLNRFPDDESALACFAKGQEELGKLLLVAGQAQQAEHEFDAALESVQHFLSDHPSHRRLNSFLEPLTWNRNSCRLADVATGDWDSVLNSPKESLAQTLSVRCQLLIPQRRTEEIAQTARNLLQQPGIDAYMIDDAARAIAACSLLELGWDGISGLPVNSDRFRFDSLELTSEQSSRSHGFRDEALQILHQAKAAGLNDFSGHWWSIEFSCLRELPEFKQLCGRPTPSHPTQK
ncbi:MAG: serine/threonine protein kinase [Planctomyces sp.]|nr:serine/threonine protein kinase [Planctomyces sp.]